MIKPRGWQKRALDIFMEHTALTFLLDATPGAGKTMFSAFCARYLFEIEAIDFVIIVVPTTALKGDTKAGFLGDWFRAGINITTVLKDGKGRPADYQGAVICYAQLPNLISTLELWGNVRLLIVFDEIHHVRDQADWGLAAERLGQCAIKILGMTGTLFRGDRKRISFVEYDDNDQSKADYSYSYRKAVTDRVCRPVEFITDDGMADFVRNQEAAQESMRISDAKSDDDARPVSNTIFRHDAEWMRAFIAKADDCLDDYRIISPDAGGLVICRPGSDENADERYLRQVAKLVRDVTGEEPEVISHDDPDANAKIERFRDSRKKWMCAVRKVSEGVDIKRLRVAVMATRPTTELLFRQIVGRVVRVQNKEANPRERATVFIAKFPQLQEWASRHSDEAEAGLRDAEDPKRRDPDDDRKPSSFVPVGSSHEDGGAVSEYGDEFSASEINAAENERMNDPQLSAVPITTLAYIRRKHEMQVDPMEAPGIPLHIEKKNLRREINNLQRRLAIRRNPDEPAFWRVWQELHRHTGAKDIDDLMDNHSIEVMRQAKRLLENWLGGANAAA